MKRFLTGLGIFLLSLAVYAQPFIREETTQFQFNELVAFTNAVRIGYADNINQSFLEQAFPVSFSVTTSDGMIIPAGTTGERPSGFLGYPILRYNKTDNIFEYNYDQSSWKPLVDVDNDAIWTEINSLWDEFLYQPPTVSFAVGGQTFESGSTQNINLNFNVNKEMVSRIYSGAYYENLGAGESHTYIYEGLSLNNSSATFTIKVIDNREEEATATKTIHFRNRVYFGSSNKELENITSEDLLAMGDVAFATTRGHSGTLNLNDEYIYIAYPTRFELCTNFFIGGFATTSWPHKTLTVTNSSGFSESFYVYRSIYTYTGTSISYSIN